MAISLPTRDAHGHDAFYFACLLLTSGHDTRSIPVQPGPGIARLPIRYREGRGGDTRQEGRRNFEQKSRDGTIGLIGPLLAATGSGCPQAPSASRSDLWTGVYYLVVRRHQH